MFWAQKVSQGYNFFHIRKVAVNIYFVSEKHVAKSPQLGYKNKPDLFSECMRLCLCYKKISYQKRWRLQCPSVSLLEIYLW